MAPRRYQCGHRTSNGLACRATGIGNSTRHYTTCIDQARLYLPARELLDRRKNNGDSGMEALRILKRRLSDVVYRAMLTDETVPLRRTA